MPWGCVLGPITCDYGLSCLLVHVSATARHPDAGDAVRYAGMRITRRDAGWADSGFPRCSCLDLSATPDL